MLKAVLKLWQENSEYPYLGKNNLFSLQRSKTASKAQQKWVWAGPRVVFWTNTRCLALLLKVCFLYTLNSHGPFCTRSAMLLLPRVRSARRRSGTVTCRSACQFLVGVHVSFSTLLPLPGSDNTDVPAMATVPTNTAREVRRMLSKPLSDQLEQSILPIHFELFMKR